jgi:hypothetical protein
LNFFFCKRRGEERRGEGRGEYLFQLHIDKANATPGFRNHPTLDIKEHQLAHMSNI